MEINMPWYMLLYVVLYGLLIAANSIVWIKERGSLTLLLFELFSGCYLISMIIFNYYPDLLKNIGNWPVYAVPLVLGLECYYSVWGKADEMVPDSIKVDSQSFEAAKVISIIFGSPAYIIAGKVFIDRVLSFK